jgi:hypothetical protein
MIYDVELAILKYFLAKKQRHLALANCRFLTTKKTGQNWSTNGLLLFFAFPP